MLDLIGAIAGMTAVGAKPRSAYECPARLAGASPERGRHCRWLGGFGIRVGRGGKVGFRSQPTRAARGSAVRHPLAHCRCARAQVCKDAIRVDGHSHGAIDWRQCVARSRGAVLVVGSGRASERTLPVIAGLGDIITGALAVPLALSAARSRKLPVGVRLRVGTFLGHSTWLPPLRLASPRQREAHYS